ncbi:MAG: protein kinase [Verrucomicrobia bacterium]|nr:protein kinase [Verrucomicrobiota bacterium]
MDPQTTERYRAQLEQIRRRFRTGLVTLLFTDLVGSTKLKQQLGDREGVALLHQHHAQLRELLAQVPDAAEISTAGDSFFLLFVKPSDAVRFALVLRARNRALSAASGQAVQDRVGVHLGEVVVEESAAPGRPKDFYGSQVDIAARVMGLAAGDQILLTRAVFDSARQVLRGGDVASLHGLHESDEAKGSTELQWLNHGPYLLKGIEEPVEICEVRVGAGGPATPPTSSEKARRHAAPDAEPVLGWRPALAQAVPGTQWVLEEKLGEGGFGEVWLGRHRTLNERRVFKFCFRAERVRSLKREVTLFRLLKERVGDHPNIVAIREVYFDEPPFFIEMDYSEGKDLQTWSEERGSVGSVPLETRLEIVAQIADALQAAHAAGVIHRDVKPGNILVSDVAANWRSPPPAPAAALPPSAADAVPELERVAANASSPLRVKAKLTDFGIGQVLSQEYLAGITKAGFTQTMLAGSSTSSHTGTQMYMAPELLAGKPASARSDIYSLGVVLYQLLVGDLKSPLTTDWQNEIVDELLRDDLKHCFAGHPEDRFATAGELAKNLRSLPERRAALTQQQTVLLKREQNVRRWRLVRSAALAAVVLVLAFTVIRFYFRTAKVRWAREQALPQATQLADAEKFREAFELALQAERYIPKDDPALTNLLGRASVRLSIETVPPGADVYAREYRAATTNWPHLGKTPIIGLRMPRGLYRWLIRKPGYAVVEHAFEGAAGTITNRFTLDEASAIPPAWSG